MRDNAYTNVMVAWLCGRALDILRLLRGQACDELMSALRWARSKRTGAWDLFREALVDDTFAGPRLSAHELVVDPHLPDGIDSVGLRVHYQGHHIAVHVASDGIRFDTHECGTPHPLRVNVGGSGAVLESRASAGVCAVAGIFYIEP